MSITPHFVKAHTYEYVEIAAIGNLISHEPLQLPLSSLSNFPMWAGNHNLVISPQPSITELAACPQKVKYKELAVRS